MIKLLCFLKRNAALSRDEFHQHWANVHGPLFANSPALTQYIARYEQNPRLAADYRRDPKDASFEQQGYDGVSAIWYHSMDAFLSMIDDPYYQQHVVPDEEYLLDRASQAWLLADTANTIVDKPNARTEATAKLLCILRRNSALSRDSFHQHWLEHHGGLFQTVDNLNKDIMAYDQNPRHIDDYALAPERCYDGVTEQWFESIERFFQSLSEPEQKTLVEPDVAYMLDPTGTHFIMSELPRVIIQ